jgi:hypothetical protein
LELLEFKTVATEWPAASCHGTVIGVDAGCQILLVVLSNGGTLSGILVPMQSKSVASAGGPKNLGFVAKGMGCWVFLGKAKAASARKQKMYNAKVVFFVHIVDGQLGGWNSLVRFDPINSGALWSLRTDR